MRAVLSVAAVEVHAGDVLLHNERLLKVSAVKSTPTGRISLRVAYLIAPSNSWVMTVKPSKRLVIEASR
jgi:hypothetical protein